MRALKIAADVPDVELQDRAAPSDATLASIDAAEQSAVQGKVQACDGIFALGDCCADVGAPLPALAQVRTSSSAPWPPPLQRLRCAALR